MSDPYQEGTGHSEVCSPFGEEQCRYPHRLWKVLHTPIGPQAQQYIFYQFPWYLYLLLNVYLSPTDWYSWCYAPPDNSHLSFIRLVSSLHTREILCHEQTLPPGQELWENNTVNVRRHMPPLTLLCPPTLWQEGKWTSDRVCRHNHVRLVLS